MSSARLLTLCAAFVSLLSSAADALTTNLIDPALPLDVHTRTLCIGASDFTTGGTHASCFGSNPIQNPATLTTIVGTGATTADLATGSLRSRSTSQTFWLGTDQLRAGGLAHAEMYDTITFEGGFTGTAELRMAIDGSFFTSEPNPNSMMTEMVALLAGFDGGGLFVGNAQVTVRQFNSGEVGLWDQLTNGAGSLSTNATGSPSLFDPADVRVILSVFFSVTPTSPEFSFLARLRTSSGLGFTSQSNQVKEAATDFGNTAQLALIVPDGVTWHSASGMFLVPEPSALALLAAASLLALRRR